jgi:hypothetical protein
MTFATAHPWPVRRRDVKVMRLKQLPPHREGIAAPEHSWLVAASTLNLLDLVTAGDWLIRRRRTTLARLQSAVQGYSGRGAVAARTAVKLVRERVDSPRETWLRLCLVLAGLPVPECNLVIGDGHGPIGRVDLVYVAYRLIIEYEGDQHRTDRFQWNRDIDRQELFTRAHWTLIRVTSERARWPRQLVRAVYQALEANGYTGPPPEFSQLWLSLFGCACSNLPPSRVGMGSWCTLDGLLASSSALHADLEGQLVDFAVSVKAVGLKSVVGEHVNGVAND